jgi:signal transduction histidine kinase
MASPLSAKAKLSNPLTVKGKLFLSAMSALLLILIFTVFLGVSSRQVSTILAAQGKATDIVKNITEIRFVTFENLLHHDERSYRQWQAKHDQLSTLLNDYPVTNNREKLLIDTIRSQQNTIAPIFNKLAASYDQPATNQNIVTQNQYQERLASMLISKQQIEISAAFKLADLKRQEVVAQRQQTSSIAVVVIVLMFLITGFNFVYVYAGITTALSELQHGAKEISKGRFNYRIRAKRRNDEFGLLASTFNNMAANLQQVDKVKSEFVLLVSHQLRTPATAVKGFLSLITDYDSKNLSAEQRKMISAAYEENERQIKLINEVLAVAQVETGEMKLDKQPTDITALLQAVIDEQKLAMAVREQTAQMTVESTMPLLAIDSGKIHIAIENLIHNASKFSPNNTIIEVSLKQTETSVQIAILDHGPGIARDDVSKLFKKFSRVSSPGTVKTEGTGLGLYLAKRLIDMHGGSIEVETAVNKGTKFIIQLPANTQLKKGDHQ